jgi:hypothetical protein
MHAAALPSTLEGVTDETVPVLDASTGGTVKMDALGPIVGTFSINQSINEFYFLLFWTFARLESRSTDEGTNVMRGRSE